jgi:hypothetical protein
MTGSTEIMTERDAREVTKLLEVAALHIVEGITVKAACEKAEIEERTYRRWRQAHPDAIPTLRELLSQRDKELLWDIAAARAAALRQFTQEVLDTSIEAADRIRMFNLLSVEMEELQRSHHAIPGQEDEAQAFLRKGPQRKPGRSRFAVEEVSPGVEVSITVRGRDEGRIIDVTPRDPEEDPE